eukprot:GHVR01107815.1.p2 GENE.GHVR01107815.1~~GHVR01107815.1.p2  ORF type:complete len:176 (+),score=32.97 GHVR01107815.1:933-1460(+)
MQTDCETYQKTYWPIQEEQLMKAGYRLAALIKMIIEGYIKETGDKETHKEGKPPVCAYPMPYFKGTKQKHRTPPKSPPTPDTEQKDRKPPTPDTEQKDITPRKSPQTPDTEQKDITPPKSPPTPDTEDHKSHHTLLVVLVIVVIVVLVLVVVVAVNLCYVPRKRFKSTLSTTILS